MRRSGDAGLAITNALIAAACLPALATIVGTVPLRVPLDANEGWNAYQTLAATSGTLYPYPPHFFFNNYPPLSFYLVAPIAWLFGDPIIAGRVLSLIAFGTLAIVIFAAARRMKCARSEAAFGALLFVAMTLSLSHYVGIDDPQFIAQAVSTAGLLLLPSKPRSSRRVVAAAVLMTTALFIKHDVIALPLACVVWLCATDRPAGFRLIVSGAAIAAGLFAVCIACFGVGFLEGLATPRGYSPAVAGRALVRWIVRIPFFVAALWLMWRRFRYDDAVVFCVVFFAIASALGLVFLGGDGVDWNVLFESNWAASLTAAVALNRLAGTEPRTIPRLAVAGAFLLLPVVAASLAVARSRYDPATTRSGRVAAAAAFADQIAFVAGRPGPALCDDLAICFWAGKPAAVDVFNLQQTRHARRGSGDDLDALVDHKYFAVIALRDRAVRLGAGFQAALERNYVAARSGPAGTSFVPN